ncbi:hypothetical protein KMW28_24140 [Flammeovirga yaeyamensis]|uniref:DUF4348 domain-containing protein n=1 Tax=Flammeovirga yaeyamensis TaxID=367791 RepID=A0AAX1NG49_9BACT|nr:hypothetical protein [Flammeovirga yaeyamensis]MBB3696527.1 hypothetical protein [Flammeovirga yaeyamensis]NMF33207.1 DUF4348 domain-containing protein [Flammeovirga yaeyamensis]QWG05513.1 hypothetical protein KMW28_24140 [Flammeovirga yaeyamensis]
MRYLLICLLFSFISCSKSKENTTNSEGQRTNSNLNQSSSFVFADKSFGQFYQKFISSPSFQLSRTQFPLEGSYNSYDGEKTWTRKEWPQMTWNLEDHQGNSQDSVSIIQNHEKFFYGLYCLDCGFSFEMQFDKIDGDWFLTYRQENNF